MKDVILLMSANPYSIVNEKTGEIENEGISISYCMTSDMLPRTEERNGNVVFYGNRVLKGSIGTENLKELTHVPAFYEAEFAVRPNSSGKAELRPSTVKFKKVVAAAV